jgi:ribosomal protein L10
MILNHEDMSAIEQSFGPDKAACLINALEKLDREQKVEIKRDLLMELATKADIADLRGATRADIADLRGATREAIAELRESTKADIAELRGATQTDIAELRGEIRRVEAEIKVLLKVLIGLSIIGMSLFSPAGVELIKLLK